MLYAAVHFSYYYPRLPEVIASHFDARGAVNGWESKQAFFGGLAEVTALVGAVLIFGIPWIIAVTPMALINLPNKAYWLSPEQMESSHKFLSAWFAWFGCAVFLVVLMAFDFAVKSNLPSARPLNPARFWYVLGGFGAFTLVWLIRIWLRFGRLPADSRS